MKVVINDCYGGFSLSPAANLNPYPTKVHHDLGTIRQHSLQHIHADVSLTLHLIRTTHVTDR